MTGPKYTIQPLGLQMGRCLLRVDGLPPGVLPEVAEVTLVGPARPGLLRPELFGSRYRAQPDAVFAVQAPPPFGATYVHVRGPEGLDLRFVVDPASQQLLLVTPDPGA